MERETNYRKGVIHALFAYGLWGILPVYWKALPSFSSFETLMYRIFFSFVTLFLLTLASGKVNEFKIIFRDRQALVKVTLASLLLTSNWYVYILAVNSNKVLEASLGYYINPLVMFILGVLVFNEKVPRSRLIAIVIAGLGVTYLTINYGRFPWVAVYLGISFALYGMIKKKLEYDAFLTMLWETMIVFPLALVAIAYMEISGVGSIGSAPGSEIVLLALAGVFTTLPLFLFGVGAKNLPLSVMGFFQYIAPTIMFVLGVAIYGETFTSTELVSFALIWTALIIFSYNQVIDVRKMKSRSGIDVEGA